MRDADAPAAPPANAVWASWRHVIGGTLAGVVTLLAVSASGWLDPARPAATPDVLPWVLADRTDDRIDFRTYFAGVLCLLLGQTIWALRWRASRPGGPALLVTAASAALATGLRCALGPGDAAMWSAWAAFGACVVALAARRGPETGPRRAAGGLDASFVIPDIAFVAALALWIWVPDVATLGGEILAHDLFEHWDMTTIGPSLAVDGGWKPLADVPVVYGIGMTFGTGEIASLFGPLDYGSAIRVASAAQVLWFAGLFVGMRLAGFRPAWAAATIIVALALHSYHAVGYPPHDILRYPNSTALRYIPDAAWICAMALACRSGRRLPLVCAGAIAAAAPFWCIDTGVSLAGAHVVAAGVLALRSTDRVRTAVIALVPCALVLGGGLAIVAAQGDLAAAREGLLTQSQLRLAGYALLPAPGLSLKSLPLYLPPVILCVALARAAGSRSARAPLRAGIAAYGLALFVYYVGRSNDFSWFRVSVPTVLSAAFLAQDALGGALGGRVRAPTERETPLRSAAIRGAPVLVAVVAILASPKLDAARNVFGEGPLPSVDLDRETDAALGVRLPAEWAGDLRDSAAAIRARVGEGGRSAIIGDLDVALYRMSGTRPWIPTVPAAATIVTPRQFERAVAGLDDPELAWVFVRTARPRRGWSRWFVPAFRAEVAKRFEPAGAAGGLEIWTRPR